MRHKMCVLLVMVLVGTAFFTGVTGASTAIIPKLVFDKASYLPDSIVTMSLRLTGVSPTARTNSVSFEIEYDGDSFELATGSADKDISNGYINLTTKDDLGVGTSKIIKVMYVNMNGDTTLKDNTDLFTVKLKVKKSAAQGAKVFTLKPVKMLNSNFDIYNVNNNQSYYNAVEVGSTANIKVLINGQSLAFDVLPVAKDGRVLVPLRKIFEALGAEVNWDQATETITATKADRKIQLKLKDANAIINGVQKKLDVPACAINGRTLVPVRFIAESFGAQVNWDNSTKTVSIISN